LLKDKEEASLLREEIERDLQNVKVDRKPPR